MKVFLDTNVLLSAFYGHGVCAELYDHCLDAHILFTSDYVLKEFREKAVGKLKFAPERLAYAIQHIRTYSILVPEARLPHSVCKDKDDDPIVAGALKAGAACIVTGDKEFLAIKSALKIPIIAPSAFWKFESQYSSYSPLS